jgi:hypothetical protein
VTRVATGVDSQSHILCVCIAEYEQQATRACIAYRAAACVRACVRAYIPNMRDAYGTWLCIYTRVRYPDARKVPSSVLEARGGHRICLNRAWHGPPSLIRHPTRPLPKRLGRGCAMTASSCTRILQKQTLRVACGIVELSCPPSLLSPSGQACDGPGRAPLGLWERVKVHLVRSVCAVVPVLTWYVGR